MCVCVFNAICVCSYAYACDAVWRACMYMILNVIMLS